MKCRDLAFLLLRSESKYSPGLSRTLRNVRQRFSKKLWFLEGMGHKADRLEACDLHCED